MSLPGWVTILPPSKRDPSLFMLSSQWAQQDLRLRHSLQDEFLIFCPLVCQDIVLTVETSSRMMWQAPCHV